MYKTQDKNRLEEFKNFLKESIVDDEEGKYVWDFYYKHLCIDDLNTYLRSKTNGSVVEVGYGNFNSSVVFVVDSLSNTKYTEFLRKLFVKLKIDFYSIYFTSYNKTDVMYEANNKQTLNSELKCIAPKVVFTIGEYDLDKSLNVMEVNKDNMDKMLALYNRDDITEVEQEELIVRKKLVWNQIKFIIKYHIS